MSLNYEVPERLNELEGIRGIAAFTVYIHHFLLLIYPSFYFLHDSLNNDFFLIQWFAKTPLGIFNDGHLPVRFFFLHSGFVLTYAFIKSGFLGKYNYIKILSATLRRYFRLTGPVLGSIIFAYFIMKFGFMENRTIDEGHAKRWISYYYNFSPDFWEAIKQSFWGTYFNFKSGTTYNSVLWTIAIELKASFLIYAMASIGSLLKFPFRIFVYCIPLYFLGLESNYACFIIGLILCEFYIFKGLLEIKKNYLKWILIICALYFGGIKTFDHPIYAWIPLFGLKTSFCFKIFKTLGSLSLILYILNSKGFKLILKSKYIHYLGKLSYSLYLVHFPILASLSSSMILMEIPHFLNFIITTVFVLVMSFILFKGVDYPSMFYPKKWINSLLKIKGPMVK